MTQADSVHSTPPTNTPVDPTRRRFMTVAAGASFAGVGALTAAAMAQPIPGALAQDSGKGLGITEGSPALRAAAVALGESLTRLKAAMAANDAAEALTEAWEAENPAPTSKRGRKRWLGKSWAYRESVVTLSWRALMDAERDFETHQIYLANVMPRDENDLLGKAALACLYDEVELCRTNRAWISQTVARHVALRSVQS